MTCTWTEDYIHTPALGEALIGDEWASHGNLIEGLEDLKDGFPGCQFYVTLNNGGPITQLAVNLTISGRKRHYVDSCMHDEDRAAGKRRWRQRVRIEFVGDCEPSTFTKGWIYFNA